MYCAQKTLIALSLTLPAVFIATPVSAGEGTDVAWLMNYYYSRTLDDCGEGRPLDQCSGLRIRGTDSMEAFEPWDPSPNSVKSGGVSMSFLRKDMKYEDLGLKKANGFVLKPNDFIDEGEKEINTLCFFPLDAWTDTRNDGGCSDNYLTKDYLEKICQSAGINTAEQWLADYRRTKNNHQKECGFEIKDRPDDADAFWQGVRARRLIQNDAEAIRTQTEIRVPTWGQDEDAQLPILAFIYTPNPGLASGLEKARDDQKRYYLKTGKWVPVIRVDLPTSNAADARFTYNEGDQHRKAPTPTVENECKSYIASATWEQRDDPYIKGKPWSLRVTPTSCGRNMTKKQQDAAYAELFSKYGNDPRWKPDSGSMYRQFVCHLEWSGEDDGKKIYARNKSIWNLEPVRPTASWDEVLKEGCNPY
ncbi:putative halovibrin [Paucimonas lemoignei]|nr:putative halovibrin [Paucimonas lemoignei]